MRQSLPHIVDSIYETALNPVQWPQTLRQIADYMNAGPAELTLMDTSKPKPEMNFYSRLPQDVGIEYFEQYYTNDLRITRLMQMPNRGGITTERLMSDDEWRERKDMRDWLERYDIGTLLACNHNTRGMYTWLGVGRKDKDNPFTEKEVATYNTILQHVARALRIQLTVTELKLRSEGMAQLLSLTDKAVLFLDQHDKVAFQNELATSLARNRVIHLCNNRLGISDNRANRALQTSLRILKHGSRNSGELREVMIFTGPDMREYGLRLMPYHGFDNTAGASESTQQAMILITCLDEMKAPGHREIEQFALLFSLSPTETNVVSAVAGLQCLGEYARQRNIRPDTARKHLKAAMSKIGVHSQKALIRRIDRFCFLHMR